MTDKEKIRKLLRNRIAYVKTEGYSPYQNLKLDERVNFANFDDGTIGIYVNDYKNKVNIWVVVPIKDILEVLGLADAESDSPSHRLLRTCCPNKYDKNEESSIYKEFRRHDKWLKMASECKERWQEFEGIPSPLPSCRITKSACDYESCPKNVWRERLTPEEIRDVEVSEKEIREGKSKTFTNVDDFINDLHKSRTKHKAGLVEKEEKK